MLNKLLTFILCLSLISCSTTNDKERITGMWESVTDITGIEILGKMEGVASVTGELGNFLGIDKLDDSIGDITAFLNKTLKAHNLLVIKKGGEFEYHCSIAVEAIPDWLQKELPSVRKGRWKAEQKKLSFVEKTSSNALGQLKDLANLTIDFSAGCNCDINTEYEIKSVTDSKLILEKDGQTYEFKKVEGKSLAEYLSIFK